MEGEPEGDATDMDGDNEDFHPGAADEYPCEKGSKSGSKGSKSSSTPTDCDDLSEFPSDKAIRGLARRGGVKRISGLIYEETRGVLKVLLENVIRDAVTSTEEARRKTVTTMDGEFLKCDACVL